MSMGEKLIYSKEEYLHGVSTLEEKLRNIPTFSDTQIDTTTKELRMLGWDGANRNFPKDILVLNTKDIIGYFKQIKKFTFSELETTKNIEISFGNFSKACPGTLEEYERYAKLKRLTLLVEQYFLIAELRQNKPQAKDRIDELFFDNQKT
jgi:hypothetical protein